MSRTSSQPSVNFPLPKSKPSTSQIKDNESVELNNDYLLKNNELNQFIKDPIITESRASLAIFPILLALIPSGLAYFLGMEDLWSEIFLIGLVGFYLYNLIQLPWELYLATRQKRFINPMERHLRKELSLQPGDATSEILRYQAQNKLWWYEKLAFLAVLVSPLLGGYLFLLARTQLARLGSFVSNFNLLLFILAAEVRPICHLGYLLTSQAAELQEIVGHPTPLLESIQRRIQGLENQQDQIRQAFATKRDISNIRQNFEPNFKQLSQLVMKQHQRERLEAKKNELIINSLQRQIQQLQHELNITEVSNSLEEGNTPHSEYETSYWLFDLEQPILPQLSYQFTSLPSFTLKLFILPITISASIITFISRHFLPMRSTPLITDVAPTLGK